MSKPINTRPRALLILGMHRSGTSAVTRVVNLLGASIGDRLVQPGHDNPSGFWESATAVQINEQLLRELGRTWYDMREMPDDWMDTAAAATALDLARKFIRRDLGGSAFCALKDPRMCLTAPLWIKAFETLKFEVSCLFVVRDPKEVVESLHRRNDWPRSPLFLMWVQYLLEAEDTTRQCRRSMVSYDQLLDDWRTCMNRVAEELELGWPVAADDAAMAIDVFLDRGQRHHRAADRTAAGNDEMPALVRSLYNACLATAGGRPEWNAIATMHSDFRKAAELYAERVDNVLTERWKAEARAQEAESQLTENASVEQMFQQATQASREAIEARLARLDEHIAGVESLMLSERVERASLEQVFQQATQASRDAVEGRLARLDEHLMGMDMRMQSAGAEQAARSRDQASLIAEARDAMQLSHETLETRMAAVEQNLTGAVQESRQDVSELQGHILRHQEVLQAVEARLQRQYALVNTVLLRLEQVAGDQLADRVSALTGKVDAVAGKVDAIHGAEMQALRQDLESNKARMASLLRSTSWRFTRPLRWISVHLLRKPSGDE